jgi:hypothetical protein
MDRHALARKPKAKAESNQYLHGGGQIDRKLVGATPTSRLASSRDVGVAPTANLMTFTVMVWGANSGYREVLSLFFLYSEEILDVIFPCEYFLVLIP